MNPICNDRQWIEANSNNEARSFYINTYPFLETFPIDESTLKNFYIEDMENRNLKPLDEFLNCYEFLWNYYLENFPKKNDSSRFRAKTFFENTLNNFLPAVKKSFSDISETLGISINVIIIVLVLLAIIVVFK